MNKKPAANININDKTRHPCQIPDLIEALRAHYQQLKLNPKTKHKIVFIHVANFVTAQDSETVPLAKSKMHTTVHYEVGGKVAPTTHPAHRRIRALTLRRPTPHSVSKSTTTLSKRILIAHIIVIYIYI